MPGSRRATAWQEVLLADEREREDSADGGDAWELLRAFAERGYDLVIGIGFAQAPIVEEVARDYPKIDFAVVDGVAERPNVASLVFK